MENKSAAIRALWERSKLAYYLHPYQRELYTMLHETQDDMVVFNIARRYGKTTTCVVFAVEQALKKKQCVIFATAYYTDLTNILFPIFDKVLNDCPSHLRPTYVQSKKLYRFKNGSEIKLAGLDRNPNALRGTAIALIIIDEASYVANLEYLYTSIIIPATTNMKFRIIIISTPPKDLDHYFLKMVKSAKEKGNYVERTILDNNFIDDKERQRLFDESGGEHSVTVQREYFCRLVRDENTTIVPEFNNTFVAEVKLPLYFWPQTTLDFGGSIDKTGIILSVFDVKLDKMLILESVLLSENTPTYKIRDKVFELEKKWYGARPVDRIADCAGQTRLDASVLGLVTRPPKKEKDSMKAAINDLRISFHNNKILIGNTGNEDLITTLELAQWKEKTLDDFKRTERLGHCDLLAALAYAHQSLNKQDYTPTSMQTPDTHYYKPITTKKNFLIDM